MHVCSRVMHRRLCHAKLIAKAGRFTIENIQHESQQTWTLAQLSTSAGISIRGCKMPDAQLQICGDKSFLPGHIPCRQAETLFANMTCFLGDARDCYHKS